MPPVHYKTMGTNRQSNNTNSSTNADDPFAEFMWMNDMEEFDREAERQFEEEEFIRNCIEQLLEEEEERETVYFNADGNACYADGTPYYPNSYSYPTGITNGMGNLKLHQEKSTPSRQNGFSVSVDVTSKSDSILSTSKLNPNAKEFTLNPNAKEFVPRSFPNGTPSYPAGMTSYSNGMTTSYFQGKNGLR